MQLVHQVEHALRLGYLTLGDQLPKVRDVVASLAINPNTVLKAYKELETKGLTAGRPGQGTFIQATLSQVALPELAGLRKALLGGAGKTTLLNLAAGPDGAVRGADDGTASGRADRPGHPRRGRFRLRRRRADKAAGPGDVDHPAAPGRRPVRPAAGTHRPARPARHQRDRLPCLAKLAATTAFTQVTVTRYGKAAAPRVAAVTCLRPSVFATMA
jgi:hypothetical protein